MGRGGAFHLRKQATTLTMFRKFSFRHMISLWTQVGDGSLLLVVMLERGVRKQQATAALTILIPLLI